MTKISDEDIDFFHSVTKDVKPLHKKPVAIKTSKSSIQARKIKQPIFIDTHSNDFQFSDHVTETVLADTYLFFATPGLQPKTIKLLRKGEIPQTRILDLHGATIDEARHALSIFLESCLENHDRCVRIIHGKGKLHTGEPILKNQVNNWLRQYPHLLAFCSAISRDGGTGAVYVLLRK